MFSLLYGLTLTSIHDYWQGHSFDYMDLCQQSAVSAYYNAVYVCHDFSSKEQVSFNFMAAVTIRNDFGTQEKKIYHCFHFASFYLPSSDGTGCHDLWFSLSVVSGSLQPHRLQHTRLPCPSPIPKACSNACPSSLWCHPTISSSVVPLSSSPQSFPASESFLMSQFFTSGGQSIGASASASFSAKKSQGWSPSEWTGWISLQSKGLSRVFSNTTVQKHQFFGTQLSSQSNSHIHAWPLEKT